MRKYVFTFFLLVLFCSFSRYTASRIFWDARVPITIFSGGYSRLIQLQDGRLMACTEWGGIKVAYSSNLGKSWGSAQTVAANPDKWPNCVPDLIQLQDGTIIVAYNPRPNTPYSEERHFSIRLRRSTDNGATWSDEIVVYDADYRGENGCWEPSLLQLPSGELQLYFADESPYTTTSEQQISLCRSFDGGLTWSSPQRISYRAGSRDGMPVPVLLKDQSAIVVAIEDNGWSGVGDFIPTTVRTPLSTNWKNNEYVPATSARRLKAVNYNYCPLAKGGAPYLRVLPNGETILSHQSPYGTTSNIKMYCYVGNNQAKGFKAMSCPFLLSESQTAMWNSVAVIDTGIVVAVAGINGSVKMMKGYPKSQFECPYSSPVVDAKIPTSDGYYTKAANQLMMGCESAAYTYGDFAYNRDSLYFYCQVYDKKIVAEGDYSDGITFFVEGTGAATDKPQATSLQLQCDPTGSLTVLRGNGTDWIAIENPGVHVQTTKTALYYRVEMAIPWSALGVEDVSDANQVSVNLLLKNGDGTSQIVERIPDAQDLKPWTWMILQLLPNPDEDAITAIPADTKEKGIGWYDLGGNRVVRILPNHVYIKDSKLVKY